MIGLNDKLSIRVREGNQRRVFAEVAVVSARIRPDKRVSML